MKKRILISIVIALVVFAGVLAMAASLGGITSATVGADDTVVASCDTNGVTAGYTTAWDAADERYEITAVTIGAVNDACDGLTMSVSLTDVSGAQIGTGSLVVPSSAATSHTVTLSTTSSAELTVGLHVVISA